MDSRHDEAVHHAIKIYTRLGLRAYDFVVMDLLAKHVWGCPSGNFVQHYQEYLTANHADIGVGTGYCLDRCGFAVADPRLVLIDLQKNCLEHAARRLARFRPETYQRNALEPIHIDTQRFDSVALGGLLHCLPGNMVEKGRVFDAVAPILADGATVFGYSLVSDGVDGSRRRRFVHRSLNRFKVINSEGDRMVDLGVELSRRFVDCKIKRIGSIAFFSARSPTGYRRTLEYLSREGGPFHV